MKKFKISMSLLVLTTLLLFSGGQAFADNDITPDGEKDIPAVFSYGDEVSPEGEKDIPAVF